MKLYQQAYLASTLCNFISLVYAILVFVICLREWSLITGWGGYKTGGGGASKVLPLQEGEAEKGKPCWRGAQQF